ncbi:hypothetical protein QA601_18390 [Chitinispirillales bacterium ANBcel5]|uniref:hypothetical protein n=1 Tax=Cellulosispirillum alkaliphilum TaxID=3039283 RepID=UPI002A4E4B13|nr:hypothetical protein [Chitinispirillales bacterium ANBcel5]
MMNINHTCIKCMLLLVMLFSISGNCYDGERDTLMQDDMFTLITGPDPEMDYNINIRQHMAVIRSIVEFIVGDNENIKDSIEYPQIISVGMVADYYRYGNGFLGGFSFRKNDQLWSFNSRIYDRLPLSREQSAYFREHRRMPEEFYVYSKEDALAKASELLKVILHGHNALDQFDLFDSVSVSHSKNNGEYIVRFRGTFKNGIRDPRDVRISVYPPTGEIMRFGSSMLTTDYSFDYKPKISKEEALSIAREYLQRLNFKFGEHQIWIVYSKIRNQYEWLFFDRTGQKSYGSSITIDCETGKIASSLFDLDHAGKFVHEIEPVEVEE